jgi:hypothetical protein
MGAGGDIIKEVQQEIGAEMGAERPPFGFLACSSKKVENSTKQISPDLRLFYCYPIGRLPRYGYPIGAGVG